MPKIWNKYSQKRNIGALFPVSTAMCLWANYIFPWWVCLFCWRKYVDRSWEFINRSQTHECGNWGWGRAIPRKGIYKRNCRCSAATPKIVSANWPVPWNYLFFTIHLSSQLFRSYPIYNALRHVLFIAYPNFAIFKRFFYLWKHLNYTRHLSNLHFISFTLKFKKQILLYKRAKRIFPSLQKLEARGSSSWKEVPYISVYGTVCVSTGGSFWVWGARTIFLQCWNFRTIYGCQEPCMNTVVAPARQPL